MRTINNLRTMLWLALWLALVARDHDLRADEIAQAVELAQSYLASEDQHERRELAVKLAAFDGEIDAVLAKLSARTYEPMRAGYRPEQKFWDAELRKKHPDDLLYFTVPKSYRTDQPAGLIVFMHGGSKTTPRQAPERFMGFPGEGEAENTSFQLGNLFEATGMIAVGPSAPWDESTNIRWCVKKSDEYVADVIADCKKRFNIDPDRVFLIGHSMGGYGAYHHALRQPDRFAAVIVTAGSWKSAYWPAVRGTPLGIIHGVKDAEKGVRPHYTDIEYARRTEELLTALGLEHTYYEHEYGHDLFRKKPYLTEYLKRCEKLRRDPYFPRVALASPNGFSPMWLEPVEHNRWLSLNEATEGTIQVDELVGNGAKEFDAWRLKQTTAMRPGAAIEAENRGDNTIAVTTQNVARFTVWLHPRMVDVAKPVKIVVDGTTRFDGRVEPSLATALESFERRGDWGLVYPMKVMVDVRE